MFNPYDDFSLLSTSIYPLSTYTILRPVWILLFYLTLASFPVTLPVLLTAASSKRAARWVFHVPGAAIGRPPVGQSVAWALSSVSCLCVSMCMCV